MSFTVQYVTLFLLSHISYTSEQFILLHPPFCRTRNYTRLSSLFARLLVLYYWSKSLCLFYCSMADVFPSTISTIQECPESLSSGSEDEKGKKIGRPNKWTASRQRKLARLYIFSRLPPRDISKALSNDDWIPG